MADTLTADTEPRLAPTATKPQAFIDCDLHNELDSIRDLYPYLSRHVVPVCFALLGGNLYVTIDEKPKRSDGRALRRLRNIAANPHVAVVMDRYDEDWSRLAWVMLRGRADILDRGDEHDRAQAALRERYPQYRAMAIEPLPVIAVRITRVNAWGALR